MNAQEIAESYTIFRCVSGSKAYGTDTEQSDTDIRGIFIAPPEISLGCFQSLDQVEYSDRDEVLYDLRKFVKLAASANPNIIELLFTDEENIHFIDPAFAQLREHRQLFLSGKAKFTFSGYAMAQMKRIRGHHKWMTNPQPVDPPTLLDFSTFIDTDGVVSKFPEDLLENTFLVKVNATTFRLFSSAAFSKPILSEDQANIQFINVDEERLASGSPLEFYGTLIVQIDTFRVQHRMWKEYWHWKKNRNPARAALEEKHGYDCKHAMHLMRLLKMAHEILRDGEVRVRRPDAKELLAIRDGAFDYDELVRTAERMDEELNVLYENTPLPHSPDRDAINALYMHVVKNYWTRVGLL